MVIESGSDTIQKEQVIYATIQDSEVIHPGRVSDSLQVLYDFSSGEGNQINDISGKGTPLNLMIGDPLAIEWVAGQGIIVKGNSPIFSPGKASQVA